MAKSTKKKLKRNNLVMLGRGWVKAGFDFGTFNQNNFKYDKASNNIYFIGFNPKILSSTINPWFIPEEGVEGFEFLVVQRKARRDYKQVQLVKQRCLDELNRKAHEREILQLAIKNGKESLQEFFSLIMDEEINQVIFYDNQLDYTYAEIIKNDTITGEELLLIDHLLQKDSLAGISRESLNAEKKQFVERLMSDPKAAQFNLMDSLFDLQWNPELTIAYAIGRDGIFDQRLEKKLYKGLIRRYCDLAKLTDSLSFDCSNTSLQYSFYRQYVNVFIASEKVTQNLIKELDFDVSVKDSVYNRQGKFSGLRVSKDTVHLEKFHALLFDQLQEACSCE